MTEHICELTPIDSETWDMEQREEVVRCRDCEHFEQGYTDGAMFDATVCWCWDNGHDYPHYTIPDGFCHNGKRRTDG